MAADDIHILRDNFALSSLIFVGAFFQALLFLVYPSRIVTLPVLGIIAYAIVKLLLQYSGILKDPFYVGGRRGRRTARVVNDGDMTPNIAKSRELVVFILGVRLNDTPLGILAPDFGNVGKFIESMWNDADTNYSQWGYLGKTSSLISTDDSTNNTISVISYWKSIEGLQRFAQGDQHRKGWDWYLKLKHTNFGIMHETYVVHAGMWENISVNMKPFGLGQAKYAGGLKEAKGESWQSMKSRMRKLVEES
ncbi:hypothetical protein BGZ60DRAFT_421143 [Tricladium varicosporioides]|nr:hypothetical protein BGZ60DRAFT_421143 [Hymenoscyphus varicosporioides]